MNTASTYLLQWKGKAVGPFPLSTITDMLKAGEISRMYQVQVDGRWQLLDEFLQKLDAGETQRRRTAEEGLREKLRADAAQRENQLIDSYEAKLAAERSQQLSLQERLAEAAKKPMPPPPTLPPALPTSWPSAADPAAHGPGHFPQAPEDLDPPKHPLTLAIGVVLLCLFVVGATYVVLMLVNGRSPF